MGNLKGQVKAVAVALKGKVYIARSAYLQNHLSEVNMFRKSILFLLALVTFVCLTAAAGFADAASDLVQAETYVKSGLFSQAEQLCISIAQNNPGSDYALKAAGKLAAVSIMTQRMPQADAQVDSLINSFHNNAELPAILYGITLRYKTVREYQRAEDLAQRICQEFGGSEQAQRIQLDLGREQALKLIADGKFAQAEEAANTIAANAGSNPGMPAALFKIARQFKEAGRNDEAVRMYQKITQDYPNSEFGGRARMAIDKLNIWNLIKTGDVNSVQAALERLINDYGNEDDLPHTVRGIAFQFEENGYYQQAKALYQKVKTDYAGDRVAAMATVDLKKCDVRAMIGTASHSVVMQKVNEFMAEFAGNWYLPKAVYQIGTEYYNRALKLGGHSSAGQAAEFYRNAADIWEMVINQLPDSSYTLEACNYAAICYEKLGEYNKANECYKRVIDNYPGYRMRWNMIYKTGRNYERMKKAGTVSVEQADSRTRAMYEKLLAEYPDCKAADYARNWLER